MPSAQQLFFPPFRLDLVNERLWRGTQLLPVRPKTFAVLRYLVEHPGRLVTRDEIRQAVWPDTYGSERAPKQCIRELRDVFGDAAAAPRFIETMARRGYRFIGQLSSQVSVASHQQADCGNQSPAASLRPQLPIPTLVGREAELTHLHDALARALGGERQVVFVTGEPGIGKTTVVDAFVARLAGDPSLWIGWGQCIEHYGAGEAYQPVLEALGRLGRETGHEHLIELLGRHAPTWLAQIPAWVGEAELEALQRKVQGAPRERMLREMAEALEVLTAERLLVLWLEDLQWSDAATLDLLAAVAQRREPARLLVVGTYRPVDAIVHGHPLKRIKQELHQHGRCQELPLAGLTEGAVAEYLVTRFAASSFPPALVRLIHQRTEGNPFFLVTLVDEWVAQGVIWQTEGHWALQGVVSDLALTVPESIRQLIEQQSDRLSLPEQQVLEAASVAGIEFSAAAVAAGIEAEVDQVEKWCEGLVRRNLFLRSAGVSEWPDATVAARYGFLHTLQQQMWYERVPAGRCSNLHRRIGEREAQAYGERAGEIAAELAMHFERGRDYRRAVPYLQQVAQTAIQRCAYREALSHLTKGLDLLKTLPDTPERTQHELRLYISLGAPLMAAKGWAAPELGAAYARARTLCQQVEETPRLFPVLYGLWVFHYTRAELRTAQELGEHLLALAESGHDAALLMEAHHVLGNTLHRLGELTLARTHLEQGIALYDPQQHRGHALLYGLDDGVAGLGYAALVLWALGYPDQALQKTHQMLTLAHEIAHPVSLAWAFNSAAWHHQCRREGHLTQEQAEAGMALCTAHGFAQLLAVGTLLRGWALATQGKGKEGIAQIQQGLVACQSTGAQIARSRYLAMLAEAYGNEGHPAEGLALLAEALTIAQNTGERFYEAEFHRLKGELLLTAQVQRSRSKGHTPHWPGSSRGRQSLKPHMAAEECFRQAIESARRQGAKSLELRAVMSLSRLWQRQGKMEEARQMLGEIYGWFMEGFATADLHEAKTLLATLS